MDKNQLTGLCEEITAPTTEKDLYAMSNYFGPACAPGSWVPEKTKDKELSMTLSLSVTKLFKYDSYWI